MGHSREAARWPWLWSPVRSHWRARSASPWPFRWHCACCPIADLGRIRFALAGLAMLPVAAWSLLRSTLPQAENYTDSLTLESIRTVYGGIVPWLAGQPFRMVEGAASALANVPGPVAISLSGLLAFLAVLAALVGWRRLDAQFLILYCGIVFVWPFPAEMPRFMGLLLPVVLVLAARGAAWLAGLRAAAASRVERSTARATVGCCNCPFAARRRPQRAPCAAQR